MATRVAVVDNQEDMYQQGADRFEALAQQAIAACGWFSVALAGGSTPAGMYALLASAPYAQRIAWNKIHFFWSDERFVSVDDAESNYRMANENLLAKVPVPRENIYRVPTEQAEAPAVADAYAGEVARVFKTGAGEIPRFDLILLGMGPDGHTASLFPGTEALKEQKRLVVANYVPKFKGYRITFTLPLLNNAAEIIFLIAGNEKAPIIQQVLEGTGMNYPIQSIRPTSGSILWLLDKAAANLLSLQHPTVE